MQTIKLVEKKDNTFELECDIDLIPLDVVEQTVNHVAKIVDERASNRATDAFVSTKDGKALWNAWHEVKQLKFINRLLFITNIGTCLYFLLRSR